MCHAAYQFITDSGSTCATMDSKVRQYGRSYQAYTSSLYAHMVLKPKPYDNISHSNCQFQMMYTKIDVDLEEISSYDIQCVEIMPHPPVTL